MLTIESWYIPGEGVLSNNIVIKYVCMTRTQYMVEIYNAEHMIADQDIQQPFDDKKVSAQNLPIF